MKRRRGSRNSGRWLRESSESISLASFRPEDKRVTCRTNTTVLTDPTLDLANEISEQTVSRKELIALSRSSRSPSTDRRGVVWTDRASSLLHPGEGESLNSFLVLESEGSCTKEEQLIASTRVKGPVISRRQSTLGVFTITDSPDCATGESSLVMAGARTDFSNRLSLRPEVSGKSCRRISIQLADDEVDRASIRRSGLIPTEVALSSITDQTSLGSYLESSDSDTNFLRPALIRQTKKTLALPNAGILSSSDETFEIFLADGASEGEVPGGCGRTHSECVPVPSELLLVADTKRLTFEKLEASNPFEVLVEHRHLLTQSRLAGIQSRMALFAVRSSVLKLGGPNDLTADVKGCENDEIFDEQDRVVDRLVGTKRQVGGFLMPRLPRVTPGVAKAETNEDATKKNIVVQGERWAPARTLPVEYIEYHRGSVPERRVYGIGPPEYAEAREIIEESSVRQVHKHHIGSFSSSPYSIIRRALQKIVGLLANKNVAFILGSAHSFVDFASISANPTYLDGRPKIPQATMQQIRILYDQHAQLPDNILTSGRMSFRSHVFSLECVQSTLLATASALNLTQSAFLSYEVLKYIERPSLQNITNTCLRRCYETLADACLIRGNVHGGVKALGPGAMGRKRGELLGERMLNSIASIVEQGAETFDVREDVSGFTRRLGSIVLKPSARAPPRNNKDWLSNTMELNDFSARKFLPSARASANVGITGSILELSQRELNEEEKIWFYLFDEVLGDLFLEAGQLICTQERPKAPLFMLVPGTQPTKMKERRHYELFKLGASGNQVDEFRPMVQEEITKKTQRFKDELFNSPLLAKYLRHEKSMCQI